MKPFGQDRLDKKHFAKHLAEVLPSYDSTSFLAIALYGSWGVGISFFLKLIDLYLQAISKEDNVLVILYYDPWNFISSDQPRKMLFKESRGALGQKDKSTLVNNMCMALTTLGHIQSPSSLSPVGG
ncbi:P-loop NTPase fold protein [Chloroflexota bacterium]